MCKLHYDRATRAGREDLLLPAAKMRDDDRDERLRQVAAEWRLRGWAPMRATDPAMLRLLPGGASERKNALRRAAALGLLRCDGKGLLARWSLVQR